MVKKPATKPALTTSKTTRADRDTAAEAMEERKKRIIAAGSTLLHEIFELDLVLSSGKQPIDPSTPLVHRDLEIARTSAETAIIRATRATSGQ